MLLLFGRRAGLGVHLGDVRGGGLNKSFDTKSTKDHEDTKQNYCGYSFEILH